MKDREALVHSAALLKPPGEPARREFASRRESLAAGVNASMAAREELGGLVGRGGRAMSEDNNRNFALFIESLLGDFDPRVLVETALWVFRSYRAHGFAPTYWTANLGTWLGRLEADLTPETFDEIAPFYRWLAVNVPAFTLLTDRAPGVVGEREETPPPRGVPEA